jgi:diacylglycerol kinase family enzyme
MIGVILNPHSGYVLRRGVPQVQQEIAELVPEAVIHVLRRTDPIALVCRRFLRQGATCIAAAGGDGTVSSVAAALIGSTIPLGVVPVGTLNHFARDVGIGRDVPAALRVLRHGYILPVDVASVNGRIFLNNSSIGVYARLVQVRERYEHRMGKWRALIWAAWLVGRRAHTLQIEVRENGEVIPLQTYLLFVGNNQYELSLVHLGQRARLDEGRLGCFALDQPRRVRLVPSIFHLLRDARTHRRVFRIFTTTELTVYMGTRRQYRRVQVACDGEVAEMDLPLTYRSLPRALRVVVPEPPPAESREARR